MFNLTDSQAIETFSRQAAEDYLYHEAVLLDDLRLHEWLDLFTEDTIYWIPSNNSTDPTRQSSLLYDDKTRMEQRVWRLLEGPAHAQIPSSRTRRMISNVEVEETDGESQEIIIYSNFVVHEIRNNDQRAVAGRYTHHLRQEGDQLRIVLKKANLINDDAPIRNLTFLI